MEMTKENQDTIKFTVKEDDIAEWKGLDKHGNCFFKFDFTDCKSGSKLKVRVPEEVGFEMILLMREQLKKFLKSRRLNVILNSREKLEFGKLKEALIDDKSLEVKFDLHKSVEYNIKHYGKMGAKISEIELAQEEANVKAIGNMRRESIEEYEKLFDLRDKKLLEEKK